MARNYQRKGIGLICMKCPCPDRGKRKGMRPSSRKGAHYSIYESGKKKKGGGSLRRPLYFCWLLRYFGKRGGDRRKTIKSILFGPMNFFSAAPVGRERKREGREKRKKSVPLFFV